MIKKLTYSSGIAFIVLACAWLYWGDHYSVVPTQLPDAKTIGKHQMNPSSHFEPQVETAAVKTGKSIDVKKDMFMGKQGTQLISGGTESAIEEKFDGIPISDELIHAKEQTRQYNAKLDLDQRLKKLVESKEGGAQWQEQLSHLQQNWENIAHEMGTPIGFSEVNCYNAGCATKLTFNQQIDIKQFAMKVFSTKMSNQWEGDTYLSGAVEVQAGVFESTWIFSPSIKLQMTSPNGV